MILDSLTHITPDGRWFNTSHDASEYHLLQEMDNAQIDRAVVVALADFISNEFVLEACQRNSDRLIPGASFNPILYQSVDEATHAFRSQLHSSPYEVLKLHPRLNRYDPLDSRCLSILEELATWDKPIPVWIDGLFYYRGGELRKSVVDTIHEIVTRFSNLKIVILHAGGSWALQIAEAIRDCPNAYLDISYTLTKYVGSSLWGDLGYLIRSFDRRMVFGSDFPEISPMTALDTFRRLTENFPEEKCTNVLYNNLNGILQGE